MAIAKQRTALIHIRQTSFIRALASSHDFAEAVRRRREKEMGRVNARVFRLIALSVYGRVAAELLALAEQFGGGDGADGSTIPFRLTQDDIASLVGASRARVNQAMVFYQKAGYVSADRDGRVTIREPEELATYCK